MGITDKVNGKVKQAAGDIADDPSLRREGRKEERKGEAKEDLARSQERADDAQDAERDGDSELAEFFRRAQGESRKGAEQGKDQLRKRLAG